MNSKFFKSPLLICLLLIGCVSKPPSASPQMTGTLSANDVLIPTNTPQPTYTSTLPAITEASSNRESVRSCVTVYPSRPDTYRLAGVAVLRSLSSKVLGLEMSLLDLADGHITVISTPNPVDDAGVSPDRKRLAYVHLNTSSSKWELTFIDARGEIQKSLWSSDKNFGFEGWLNDRQVVVLQDSKSIIVDLMDETQLYFSPADFPDFDSYLSYPFIAFDPLVTRVFYRSSQINLVDLSTKSILTSIEDHYDRAPIVDWQASGERAAVIAPMGDGSSDEIFIVERDGHSRQLTHLYDTFGRLLTIHSLRWSPDEEKIAFWLSDDQGKYTLMVATVNTGEVANHCILNDSTTRFPRDLAASIWSPDGRYLMAENRYAEDANRLLVVDLLENIAFPIAENANPVGWMVENK